MDDTAGCVKERGGISRQQRIVRKCNLRAGNIFFRGKGSK